MEMGTRMTQIRQAGGAGGAGHLRWFLPGVVVSLAIFLMSSTASGDCYGWKFVEANIIVTFDGQRFGGTNKSERITIIGAPYVSITDVIVEGNVLKTEKGPIAMGVSLKL